MLNRLLRLLLPPSVDRLAVCNAGRLASAVSASVASDTHTLAAGSAMGWPWVGVWVRFGAAERVASRDETGELALVLLVMALVLLVTAQEADWLHEGG